MTDIFNHEGTMNLPTPEYIDEYSSDSEIYLQNFELPKIVPIENPPAEQPCLKQQRSPGEIFITENFTPPTSPPNQKTIRILIHHEEPKVALPQVVNRKRKRRTKKPDEISRKVEVAENFDLGDYLGIQNAIENRDFDFSDFSHEDDEKRIKLFFENTEPKHHIHPQAFIECGNGKFHHGIGHQTSCCQNIIDCASQIQKCRRRRQCQKNSEMHRRKADRRESRLEREFRELRNEILQQRLLKNERIAEVRKLRWVLENPTEKDDKMKILDLLQTIM